MIPLRYLLDEHIPRRLQRVLRRATPGVAVLAVGDAGAPVANTPDEDLLCWCEENDFVLLTNNRKTMPRHLRDHLALGRHVPGIFVVNLSHSLPGIVDELVLIAHASMEGEHEDRIQYLSIT